MDYYNLYESEPHVTDQSYPFPKFFVTAPTPCPYMEGREERKVFTDLASADASELNEALGRVGFRRSQSVAYRPACEGCSACISVRVLAQDFKMTRSMRRCWQKNKDLKVIPCDAYATDDQYQILKAYLESRHEQGGMANMDEFEYAEMVESSPVASSLIEYREPPEDDDLLMPGKLIATAFTDILSDGLSMVYSFFDPVNERDSLGTFMILDHILRTRKTGLRYVYLGYWVKDSSKMSYKARFQPQERLGSKGWKLFAN